MKPYYFFLSFAFLVLQVQAQQTSMSGTGIRVAEAPPLSKAGVYQQPGPLSRNAEPTGSNARNSNSSAQQFSTDIVIRTDTTDQRNVKIATAFNGWIFAAYTINNPATGGVEIRKSTDGGLTWTTFLSLSSPGVTYPAIDLLVAGNDTATLSVFIAGVIHNVTQNYYGVWIDKYHATSAIFEGENFGEGNPYPIYDVAIASDYRHPSYVSAPYSIGLIYSKRASLDSVIYVSSLDAGLTYTSRQTAFTTPQFARKVAISFAIGTTYSNGRYVMVFESRQSVNDTVGHIIYTHTSNDPSSSLEAPLYIDSANSTLTNKSRDPKIASMNDGTDNAYGNSSVVVSLNTEYAPGDGEVFSLVSVVAIFPVIGNWTISTIHTPGNNESQGNVIYNDFNRKFYSTCYDSLHQHLTIDTVGIGVISNSWNPFAGAYNDLTTNLQNPWPSLSVDPSTGTTNYAWNSESVNGKGIALFDAENNLTAIPVVASVDATVLVYPNPSNGLVNFNFTLKEEQKVELSVFTMPGEKVFTENEQGALAVGDHTMQLDLSALANGVYIYQVRTGNKISTGRITLAH